MNRGLCQSNPSCPSLVPWSPDLPLAAPPPAICLPASYFSPFMGLQTRGCRMVLAPRGHLLTLWAGRSVFPLSAQSSHCARPCTGKMQMVLWVWRVLGGPKCWPAFFLGWPLFFPFSRLGLKYEDDLKLIISQDMDITTNWVTNVINSKTI